MWTTRVQSKAGALKSYCYSLHPSFITHSSAVDNCYLRGPRSLWIWWQCSHTLIPRKYQIFVWSLKCSWILESLASYGIHFIWTIFTHLFNFNLFCFDNFNFIRIKFLSLAADHGLINAAVACTGTSHWRALAGKSRRYSVIDRVMMGRE
jgi:hypothetical protein